MRDPMIASLVRLLELSLTEWGLTGVVREEAEGHIRVHADDADIKIGRATAGMPFRWVLIVDGRRRTAASVGGVLRIVRQTLAPGYEPLSVRIAPAPIVPLPVQGRKLS